LYKFRIEHQYSIITSGMTVYRKRAFPPSIIILVLIIFTNQVEFGVDYFHNVMKITLCITSIMYDGLKEGINSRTPNYK
jgi:hypothetical protein